MSATPDEVWALVSDITNTGKFSPETFEAEWIDGAIGPAVGARFRGHVRRNGKGPVYWTKCTIKACEPGRVFTFQVDGAGGKAVNTWSYTFAPSGDGTDVTESFSLSQALPFKLYWAVMGRWRGKTNRDGMRTTLERIKDVVEAPAAS